MKKKNTDLKKDFNYKEIIHNIENNLKIIDEKFDKKQFQNELETLSNVLEEEEFWNTFNYLDILKKYNSIKNILENIVFLNTELGDIKDLICLAENENNQDFIVECRDSLLDLLYKTEQEKLKTLFTQHEDKNDCYLEIHAGSGGDDAKDFAAMIYRMYLRWLEKNSYEYKVIDSHDAEITGYKSVIIKAIGLYAFAYLKSEDGIHRLVRISPFNSEGKRQTSFVAVSVYAEIDSDKEVNISLSDLKIQTFRSSGAGGQHVNTTDSAVRIVHIPTGVVVSSQAERSQHRNKDIALKMLQSKLYNLKLEEMSATKKNNYNNKLAIDFGSQIRSYVMHPYTMVKDHRTLVEISDIKSVFDGEIDSFMHNFLMKNSQ